MTPDTTTAKGSSLVTISWATVGAIVGFILGLIVGAVAGFAKPALMTTAGIFAFCLACACVYWSGCATTKVANRPRRLATLVVMSCLVALAAFAGFLRLVIH